MGRVQVSALSRRQHEPVHRLLPRQVKGRRPAGDVAVLDLQVLAAAEVVVTGPDQEDEIALAA